MKTPAAALFLLFAAGASAATLPLSRLDLGKISQVSRPTKPGLSAGNQPIAIAGRSFPDGVSSRGSSRLEIALDGKASAFHAWTGVTDDTHDPGPVWFEAVADGKVVFAGEPQKLGDPARAMDVPLAGVKDLVLVVQAPDQPRPFTAWAGASIDYDGAAPVAVALAPQKPYLLTPPAPDAPRIVGAAVTGARPGHDFLFTVPVTGRSPIRFSAEHLPAGLALDAATGRITGSVVRAGDYDVLLTARNAAGEDRRLLRVRIGDTLALTPPMGWNSWNCFANAVTAADVRSAADTFVRAGLIRHGWTYINVDDFWETRPLADDPVVKMLEARARERGRSYALRPMPDPLLVGEARDAQGRINPNKRFPDMAAMAAYIHGLGLKAGLYSSPGPLTCGQCTASYGHEAEDAARFAAWGFDYLKYDWCSYALYNADDSRAEHVKPYALMGSLLRRQPRDIVFSLCQYGDSQVWEWGADVDGNCWRTTGDISDNWGSMSGIGFSQNGHEKFAGPGHWNDPDMLVVGWVGWGPQLHSTRLTPDEQYTHLSLWSLLASPLLIGCDLTRLDDFTLNLLTNDEVLAVDQDPLGRPAGRVARDRDLEVWARPLADGSVAVGLFNRGEVPARVSADWGALGLSGPRAVRDLWRQSNLGVFNGAFSSEVPRHGVVLVRIAPPPATAGAPGDYGANVF